MIDREKIKAFPDNSFIVFTDLFLLFGFFRLFVWYPFFRLRYWFFLSSFLVILIFSDCSAFACYVFLTYHLVLLSPVC